MNILHLSPRLRPGSINQLASDLAAGLQQLGFRNTVMSPPNELVGRMTAASVKHHTSRSISLFTYFAELKRLISENPPKFKLLAISREETMEETIAFRDQYSFPFEMGIDPDRTIYNLYASMYVPRTFLIDRSGKVVALDIEFNPDNLQTIWEQANNM